MKVLWLSGNPALYSTHKKSYNNGGWIGALEAKVRVYDGIELAIAFIYDDSIFKVEIDKTTYYPINLYNTRLKRLFHNLFYEKYDKFELEKIQVIIDDFQPEVIHVWGTEISFGLISKFTTIPIVIHIQGILNPILNTLFIPGVSRKNYIKNSDKGFFVRILNNQILRFWKHNAKREIEIFKNNKFFMGRTNWDKNISSLLSKELNYFHCDEILRYPFYKAKVWQPHNREKIIISSVLSTPSYKGIDLVLKCANILKNIAEIDFEWNIIGVNECCFAEKLTGIKSINVNVNIKGIFSAEEVIDCLLNSDLYIHTSYIDNSPNSVCEAQMIGIPVISTNVGGVSSLIENSISGILVPANDPFYLASKIVELFKDKDKSLILGAKGHQIALSRHNQDTIVEGLIETYKSVSEC